MGDPARGGGHTVLSVLRGAEAWLQRRSVDAPRRSAELLLGKVLGLGRLEMYLAHDRPLDDAERAAMRQLVARRGEHVPVAYLLGNWSFRGLELEVGPAVLIPRPETELLVEHALAHAPPGGRVLNLGTGSGAIAIAMAVERPDLHIVATDQSRNALALATANVARHGVAERIELLGGDWWHALRDATQFDLVVSNPPYIDPQAPEGLAADVAAHEPPLALYSAAGDVLSCYRAIVAGLAAHLVADGWFVAETGVGASAPALQLLQQQPFLTAAQLLPDPAGIDRFLLAQRT